MEIFGNLPTLTIIYILVLLMVINTVVGAIDSFIRNEFKIYKLIEHAVKKIAICTFIIILHNLLANETTIDKTFINGGLLAIVMTELSSAFVHWLPLKDTFEKILKKGDN